MPSERRGTVTDDIAGYIKKLSGSAEWRGDKAGTIRMPVGKVSFLHKEGQCTTLKRLLQLSFPVDDVIKNVRHFLGSVKRATGNERDMELENKSKGPKAG
jgi:large subunit ribosomal protein L1